MKELLSTIVWLSILLVSGGLMFVTVRRWQVWWASVRQATWWKQYRSEMIVRKGWTPRLHHMQEVIWMVNRKRPPKKVAEDDSALPFEALQRKYGVRPSGICIKPRY